MRFQRIGLAEGLSQPSILCTIQDSRGFIWFGTQEGLNRYDGHEIRVFRKSAGNELPDNFIQALAEDRNGQLWLGTYYGGLVRFDPATERFEPIPLAGAKEPGRSPYVTALHVDRSGRLWVGSAKQGVWLVQPDVIDPRVVQHWPDPIGIRVFHEDAVGRIWTGSDNWGLTRFNAERSRGIPVPDSVELGFDRVTAITSAVDGVIWVGHAQGIQVFDPQSMSPVDRRPPPIEDISALHFDRTQALWIGTSQGLYRLPSEASELQHLTWNPSDASSLSENVIASVYEDREANLWFGTWLGGVNLLRAAPSPFEVIGGIGMHEGARQQIGSIVEDARGEIWVAPYLSAPLSRWNPVEDRFEPVGDQPMSEEGVGPFARALGYDVGADRIWVASNDGILSAFDPQTRQFITPEAQPIRGDSVEEIRVADGRLFIATRARGLLVLESGSLAVARRIDQSDGLPSDYVNTSQRVADELWVGTTGGIAVYDATRLSFLRIISRDNSGLADNDVTSIHADGLGAIWVGTQIGGLHRLIGAQSPVVTAVFDSSNGLPSDAISGILSDDRGNLWVSVGPGVSLISPDGWIRNFATADGLQDGGFLLGSYDRGAGDRLYFGGVGVLVIHSNRFQLPDHPPQPTLTDFLILNEPVSIGGDETTLSRGLAYGGIPQVRPGEFLITFKFAALHYDQGLNLRYGYRISELDDRWLTSPAGQNQASYSHLQPGSYEFQVRTSFDGINWSAPTTANFRVLPPIWRTWQAYLVYSMVAALLIWIPANGQLRRRRERQQHRKAIAESEQRLRMSLWASGDEFWYYDVLNRTILLTYFDSNHQQYVVGKQETLEALAERVHPDDLAVVQDGLRQHLQDQTRPFEAVYRRRFRDDWRWTFARGMAVQRDDDGRVTFVAGTRRDIHEQRMAQLQLEDLNQDLEQKVEDRTRVLEGTRQRLLEREKMAALGDLVSGVAHELNTPIGITLTASSHLEDEAVRYFGPPAEVVDPRERGYAESLLFGLGMVRSNMERASELIRNFKQIAVDQSAERPTAMPFRTYVLGVIGTLKPVYEKTGCQVDVECPESMTVRTYQSAVFQILQNLISNSVLHGLAGIDDARIRLVIREQDGSVVVDYTDNGKGIDPSIQNRIFDPFVTTTRSMGRGLGMHLVYNLVTQLMQGSIRLMDSGNQGVHVQIRFPNLVTVEPSSR